MKNLLSFTGWIIAVIFCSLYFSNSAGQKNAELKADTLRNILSQKLPEVAAMNIENKAISEKRNLQDSISLAKKSIPLPGNPVAVIDTTNQTLRDKLTAAQKDLGSELLKKKDTISFLRQINSSLLASNTLLKKNALNVTFANFNPKALPDTSNASIYAKAFKKSKNQSLFSPQINYLRIFNQRAGGTINGAPYFDYEQTNDEINQLLFQARASDNISSGQFSIGAGVELKLNRTAINGAVLGNPFTKRRPTFTIGFRQDIYRIRF